MQVDRTMNRVKNIAAGCAVVMLSFLMAGCGEETQTSAESATPKPVETQPTKQSPAAAKPAQVKSAETVVKQVKESKQAAPEPSVVNPLTGETAKTDTGTSGLNLALTDEERLGESGSERLNTASGLTHVGDDKRTPSSGAFDTADNEDEVTLSGGLITKKNEPDFRDSVEGATLSLEVKY